MTTATSKQIGGSHYVGMGIQPIEFATANKWDAGAFSILKYLSRHERKNGLEDVKKARHFVELREQFVDHSITLTSDSVVIPMTLYLAENAITGSTSQALMALDVYARLPRSVASRLRLLDAIDFLIADYETGFTRLL